MAIADTDRYYDELADAIVDAGPEHLCICGADPRMEPDPDNDCPICGEQ